MLQYNRICEMWAREQGRARPTENLIILQELHH